MLKETEDIFVTIEIADDLYALELPIQDRVALATIRARPRISNGALAKLLGVSDSGIRTQIRRFKSAALVKVLKSDGTREFKVLVGDQTHDQPGCQNPIVVEAIQEIGIDISANQTKAVFDMVKSGKSFAYVITVCDETGAERCRILPGVTTRLHWSFLDPSALQGGHDEKLVRTRKIRDTIKAKVEDWCAEVCLVVAA